MKKSGGVVASVVLSALAGAGCSPGDFDRASGPNEPADTTATLAAALTVTSTPGFQAGTVLSQVPLVLNTPWGGRSTAVTIDPSNASRVLVVTESGGMFRSTNGGASWSHVENLVPSRFADVRFDPRHPNIVLAAAQGDSYASNHGGIWRSTDSGATWTKPATGDPTCLPNPSAFGIAYAPDSERVYIGTTCGLAASANAGASWTHSAPTTGSVSSVLAHAGGIVDIIARDGHHRSTNNGATFTPPNPNSPTLVLGYDRMPNVEAHALSVSPFSSQVLFIGVFGGVLFESDDGGVTWNNTNAPGAGNGRPTFVKTRRAIDGNPAHYDTYFSNTVNMYRATCVNQAGQQCTGPWVPVDISARPIATGPWNGMEGPGSGHTDNADMDWPTGTNCPAFIVGDGGVLTPSACGDTAHWAVTGGWATGFNALQVFQVTGQTLQNNSDYYFGTQDNSLYASTDAGATFNGFGNEGAFLEIPRHLDAPTGAGQILVTVGFWVMFDGSNFDGTSPRGAKGWPQPPNAGDGEAPLVIEPGVYFEWGGNDLYLTVNPLPFLPTGPLTWTLVNGASIGNTRMGRPQWVGPPSNPVLFQGVTRADGTHGLVRIDGARTGTATVTSIDAGLVDIGVGVSNPANNLMFAVDPSNANRLIAADLGAQTMVTTKDGGAHWTPDPELTSLITGGGQFRFSGIFSGNFNSGPSTGFALAPVVSVSIIQIDPNNGNHILVGTEDAGLFASLNGGDNWFSVPDSITTKASTSFFFDERTQNILVSTYARGLWQLTLPQVSACVFAPNRVTIADRTVVGAAVAAGTFLEVGASATLDGDGTVGGNALGRSNGRVTGDLTLGGHLDTQQGFSVAGTLVQNDSPVIPTLVQRTFTVGTGSQTISTNVTLNPGDFGNVTISAGRTVTLNPGVFHFASLNVEPDANLVANGSSEVDVQGTFQLGDRADVISAPGLNVYSNGTFVRIGTDATFSGVLVAPNASVDVGSRTVVTGCLGASSVTFEPDVSLQSAGRTLPLGPPEAPTCTDGIKNDGETGVDCGGPSCPPCPTGTIRAVATVQADWGAGYCVELDVTNLSAFPTTTWNVGLNLNGTNITQSWNGTFSGATGNINVAPAFDWNRVIMPGATNNSVGFCANRPAGAGTATVTSASGSF